MDLKSYFAEIPTEECEEIAKRAGTNWAYLRQVVYGHRKASPALGRRLHDVTQLPLGVIRPDIWAA